MDWIRDHAKEILLIFFIFILIFLSCYSIFYYSITVMVVQQPSQPKFIAFPSPIPHFLRCEIVY